MTSDEPRRPACRPDSPATSARRLAALDRELGRDRRCSSPRRRTEADPPRARSAPQATEKLAPAAAPPTRRTRSSSPRRYAQLVHADQARRADGGAGRRPRGQAQGARPPPRGDRRAIARAPAAAPSPTPVAGRGWRGRGAPPPSRSGRLPPSLSRVVLAAQEDLRREIARAMHDGPAQSLTNIVLQAQIVERLVDRGSGAGQARGPPARWRWSSRRSTRRRRSSSTSGRWSSTTWASCPTLRRATRERGRRAHVPVEFESMGADRRLPMDLESGVFRILDEALAALPRRSAPRRCRSASTGRDELEARLSATRTPAVSGGGAAPGRCPRDDVPAALAAMIQDRHDARDAAVEAAEQAADRRPAAAGPARHPGAGRLHRRDRGARRRAAASSACVVALPPAAEEDGAAGVTDGRDGAENGPGILETSLVLGLAALVAPSSSCSSAARWRTPSACWWTPPTASADRRASAGARPGHWRDRRYHRPTGRGARPRLIVRQPHRSGRPALISGGHSWPSFTQLLASLRQRRGRPGSRGVRADPRPHRHRRDRRPHLPGRPGLAASSAPSATPSSRPHSSSTRPPARPAAFVRPRRRRARASGTDVPVPGTPAERFAAA